MTAAAVELVLDARADLGEGPRWDARGQRLLWVDIMRGRVHAFRPATAAPAATWTWAGRWARSPCAADGGVVLAVAGGFARLDLEVGAVEMLAAVEADRPGNRMNDGACDAAGRFWAGTMAIDEGRASGRALPPRPRRHRAHDAHRRVDLERHRLEAGRTPHVLRGQPDPAHRRVRLRSWRAGAIANRRTFVELPPEAGFPDGITVDAEGFVWVALWGGAALHRYDPDGRAGAHRPAPGHPSHELRVRRSGPRRAVRHQRAPSAERGRARAPAHGGRAASPAAGRGGPPREPLRTRRVSRLEFHDVHKSFRAVQALRGVCFAVEDGEAHAIVGENGAGKSTLLRILAGSVTPDQGELRLDGERLRHARAAGRALARDRRRPPGAARVPEPERDRERLRRARDRSAAAGGSWRARCASGRASCWPACTSTSRRTRPWTPCPPPTASSCRSRARSSSSAASWPWTSPRRRSPTPRPITSSRSWRTCGGAGSPSSTCRIGCRRSSACATGSPSCATAAYVGTFAPRGGRTADVVRAMVGRDLPPREPAAPSAAAAPRLSPRPA